MLPACFGGFVDFIKITDSAIEPVGIDEILNHLKITDDNISTEELAMLEIYVLTARRWCESYRGEAFTTQVFEASLDDWPCEDEIELPIGPLQSVTSVKYYDIDDTENIFASTEYHVDTYCEHGEIKLRYGHNWPSIVLRTSNAILIRFVSGYGDSGEKVPENYRLAIMMLAGHLWSHREDSIEDIMVRVNLFGVKQLLDMDKGGFF